MRSPGFKVSGFSGGLVPSNTYIGWVFLSCRRPEGVIEWGEEIPIGDTFTSQPFSPVGSVCPGSELQ